MKRFATVLALLLTGFSVSNAQPVQQSGTVVPGHVVRWVTNGVIGDGGTPTNPLLSGGLGMVQANLGICQQNATGSNYNRLCFNVTPTGAGLSLDNVGTATGGFTFKLNGVTQGLATVTLPVSVGDAACFSNTTGGLRDCGGAFTGFANPTAKVGPTATNGTATTAIRSDGAPAIDLTANYNWSNAAMAWTNANVALTLGAASTTGNPAIQFRSSGNTVTDWGMQAQAVGSSTPFTGTMAIYGNTSVNGQFTFPDNAFGTGSAGLIVTAKPNNSQTSIGQGIPNFYSFGVTANAASSVTGQHLMSVNFTCNFAVTGECVAGYFGVEGSHVGTDPGIFAINPVINTLTGFNGVAQNEFDINNGSGSDRGTPNGPTGLSNPMYGITVNGLGNKITSAFMVNLATQRGYTVAGGSSTNYCSFCDYGSPLASLDIWGGAGAAVKLNTGASVTNLIDATNAQVSGYIYTDPARTIASNGVMDGVWGATSGAFRIFGSSTGYTQLASANAGASNFTVTLPAATGTVALTGSSVASFSAGTTGLTPSTATTGAVTLAGTLNVANGGSGQTSLTANAFLTGNGTSGINQVAVTGLVLGNGASAPNAYVGTSCTNQVITALSAAGAATCTTITTAYTSGIAPTASPTFTGTITAATIAASGVISTSNTVDSSGPTDTNASIHTSGGLSVTKNMWAAGIGVNAGSGNAYVSIGSSAGDVATSYSNGTVTTYAGYVVGAGGVCAVASTMCWYNSGTGSAGVLMHLTKVGTMTFDAGPIILTQAAATAAAGQISYGSTTAAAANCNVASPTPTGCIVVNVAGTTRYIPYY